MTRSGNPQIRIANRSRFPLENVRVRFPSQTENYGTIPPDNVSDYGEIEKAYRYASIEATVQGELAILQPSDYTGEEPLGGGKYTYALTINDDAQSKFDRLRLDFITD